jgi:uncharacterized protein
VIGPGVAQQGILRSYMRRLLLLAALVAALMPAQKYEMERYVFGLFRKGPKFTSEDSPERQKIQEGHMANINRMAESGALLVAGPLLDNGDARGILIFKDTPLEDVRKMIDQDPAVQSGRLVVELHPWMAAKGLRVNGP